MLYDFFKSVLEQDSAPVVLCDLNHTVVYMNPAAAESYQKSGGYALVGRSLLDCHTQSANERIRQVVSWFAESRAHNRVYTFRNENLNKDVYMIALRSPEGDLIGYYEKHEFRTRESAKLYDFSNAER